MKNRTLSRTSPPFTNKSHNTRIVSMKSRLFSYIYICFIYFENPLDLQIHMQKCE